MAATRSEGGQRRIEKEVSGGELVDALVVMQQGIVEAEAAQGRNQGEPGGGEGDLAEGLRGELAGEDDDGDPTDEPAGVGAAEGLDRAPGDPSDRRFLLAV